MSASELPAAVVASFVDDVEPERRYIGLATRAIAFVLDAAVIDLIAVLVGLGASLILSLLHLPKDVRTVLVGVGVAAFILGSIGYFVTFWSTTGQTPGARVMQIRVLRDGAGTLGPRRAFIRCIGIFLGALPLFLGYVLILFDDKRRGFQDRIARTVVVDAPQLSIAAVARANKRAAGEAARRATATR